MKKSTLSVRLVLFGARFAVAAFAVFAVAAVAAAQMPGGGWHVPGSTIIIRDAREEVVVHWYHSNPSADTFYISKAKELAELANIVNGGNNFWEKTVVLTDDIDLSAYGREYNGGKGWIPIGSAYYDGDIGYIGVDFAGVFDGNGKTVRNLYINDPNGHYIGLFGVNYGTVKNLGVVNVDVLGLNDVGGLAGNGKEIINCYSTGTVKGVSMVGGLVGSNYGYGSVTANSYSTATVTGVVTPGSGVVGYNIGGLAGAAWAGAVITNSYATGTVTGVGGNIGGLAGGIGAAETENPSFVLNSAALNPSVTGNVAVGRVVGNMHEHEAAGSGMSNNAAFSGMLVNGYLPTAISTGADHPNGQSYNASAIDYSSSLGNRFMPENGWTIQRGYLPGLFGNLVAMPPHLRENADPNVGVHWYHSNSSANTFHISKAEELAELAELVNTGIPFAGQEIVLTDNIDLSAYGAGFNEGRGWIPIGRWSYNRESEKYDVSMSFHGTFNGNGKTVKNLYINDQNGHYIGLFGNVGTGGTVKNLGVVDVNVLGVRVVGGLAGGSPNTVNCYTTGTVRGHAVVGGLLGNLAHGIITNSYSTAAVTGIVIDTTEYAFIGGLVGGVWTGGQVKNCYAAGEVKGYNGVGGLVGGAAGAGSHISNSAALNPSVTRSGWGIGRVVGNVELNSLTTLLNNAAFSGMFLNGNIITNTSIMGADHQNGQNYDVSHINNSSWLNERFTPGNGWTIQNGYLPGLFGNLVAMPPHLRTSAKQLAAPAAPAPTGEFTAGPNPASRQQAGTIRFYYTGTKPLTGNLTIYNASGNAVNKVRIADNAIITANTINDDRGGGRPRSPVAFDQSRRLVGSWDLTDRRGRLVSDGTYLVRGVITTSDGKRERVSVVVGVR